MTPNLENNIELNDFTPKEFFVGILRHWLLIFSIITLALASTLLFYMYYTKTYTSSARILIEERKSALTNLSAVNSNSNQNPTLDAQRSLTNQVQYLQSLDLAKRVGEVVNFQRIPEFIDEVTKGKIGFLEYFMKNLKIGLLLNSNVIEISYTSQSAELSAKMVNVITTVYIDQRISENSNVNDKASDWLGVKVTELQTKQREIDAKIVEYRIENGIFEGQNNQKLLSEQLTLLNSSIAAASNERSLTAARADLIEKLLARNGNLDSARDVLNSSLIQQYRQQVLTIQRRIAEFSETLLPSHPRLLSLNAELNNVNEQIRIEAHNVMLSLRNEVEISNQRERSLKGNLNDLKSQEADSLLQEVELNSLRREAAANRILLDSYLTKYRESDVRNNTNLDDTSVQVISKAVVPLSAAGIKRSMVFAIMGMVGLLFGIVIATFRTLNGSKKTPLNAVSTPRISFKRDAKQPQDTSNTQRKPFRKSAARYRNTKQSDIGFDDLSFMAAIPQSGLTTRERNLLKNDILSHLDSEYANSFIDLVDNLMLQSNNEFQKHFMISGLENDNESYEAILNLGRILDMKGAKVLIIDLDLNSQFLSKRITDASNFGFSDVITGGCYFEDCLISDTKSNLEILLSGTNINEIGEIIVSEGMTEFLEELDGIYDVILVHSNDVLQSHITKFIDGQIDLTMLVADWEDRAAQHLQTALATLKDQQSSDFGLLLMGADMQEFDRVAS